MSLIVCVSDFTRGSVVAAAADASPRSDTRQAHARGPPEAAPLHRMRDPREQCHLNCGSPGRFHGAWCNEPDQPAAATIQLPPRAGHDEFGQGGSRKPRGQTTDIAAARNARGVRQRQREIMHAGIVTDEQNAPHGFRHRMQGGQELWRRGETRRRGTPPAGCHPRVPELPAFPVCALPKTRE